MPNHSWKAAAYGVLAVADTTLAGMAHPNGRRLRRLTKPLLMPALAAAFASSTRDSRKAVEAPARKSTIAAQAFSWGGDVALLGGSERSFLAGVGSFLAAHVGYVAGFRSLRDRDGRDPMSRSGPRAAAIAWMTLAPVMSMAAGRKDPKLRVPVAAYAAALATMFGTSTLLDRRLPAPSRRKVVLGTSLFLASDSVLGVRQFLLDESSPRLDAVVMATYTAGQWFIADGLATALISLDR